MTLEVDKKSDALWRWLQRELGGAQVPALLATIGLGDGQLLEALERHAPATRVLALEPDPVNARLVRSTPRALAWIERRQLIYLVDPDYAGRDEAWRIFPAGGLEPTVLVHPEVVLGEGVARAAQVLKKIVFGVQANAEARRTFAPRYLVNSIRNIPAIVRGSDVRALADKYRGVPAVIAAAGPSLDLALDDLREVRGRALLIAADTALRPLLSHGIAPHLVVGLDPSTANMRHFLSLPECRDTWLVGESALDRHATAVFDDRTFWFQVSNHHPWPWLAGQGIDVGTIDVWGSVLTGAFSVACLAGCDPIAIVGADLAYTGGRPYARGTTYEFNWARNAAAGLDAEACWQAQIAVAPGRIVVPDLHGVETLTTESLVAFRDWMVARVQRSGRRVVNATGAGILHGERIEQRALADALSGCVEVPPVHSHARRFANVRPSALASQLRTLRDALNRGRTSVEPFREWTAFSGGTLDRTAVGHALDEAARTLETRRGSPSIDPVISWSRFAGSAATRGLLTSLPESVARFRDRLAGADAPHAPADEGASAESFDEAVRLLNEITSGMTRLGEIALCGDRTRIESRPISEACNWPEHMRWAILALEALLGRTCGGESRPRTFEGPVCPRESVNGTAGVADASPMTTPGAALAMQLAQCFDGDGFAAVALTGTVTEAHHARRLTGTIRTLPARSRSASGPAVLRVRQHNVPRVLSNLGVARAHVAYQAAGGAVCVTPQARESFVVRDDGSVDTRHAWPRPIVGELPMGAGGAVAWGSGLAELPAISPAYVMYRRRADEMPLVEELPFRPTRGIWWEDRVYWMCLPAASGELAGIVSWAPGRDGRTELSGVTPLDIHVTGDSLVLEPCHRNDDFTLKRHLAKHGAIWRPGGPLGSIGASAYGGSSARDSRGGWTAVAYPQADLIELVSSQGQRVAMTCYYPFRLAWAGRSLVVSTLDRELLFFADLIGTLDGHR